MKPDGWREHMEMLGETYLVNRGRTQAELEKAVLAKPFDGPIYKMFLAAQDMATNGPFHNDFCETEKGEGKCCPTSAIVKAYEELAEHVRSGG